MHYRRIQVITVLVGLLALAMSAFAAEVPKAMSYRGNLTDQAGQPVAGVKSLVFKLYTVETGGTAFWSETQTVTVSNGQFTVLLGAATGNELNPATFSGDTWLGIQVGTDAEMTPRQKMTSVAYAFTADSANTANIATTAKSAESVSKPLEVPVINGGNMTLGTATNANRIVLPTGTTGQLAALTNVLGSLAFDTTKGKAVVNNGAGWQSLIAEYASFRYQGEWNHPANTWSQMPLNESSDSARYPLTNNSFFIRESGKYSITISATLYGNSESFYFAFSVNGGGWIQDSFPVPVEGAHHHLSLSRFTASLNAGDVIRTAVYVTSYGRWTRNPCVELTQIVGQ